MSEFCRADLFSYSTPNRPVNPGEIMIGAARFWLSGYCGDASVFDEVGIWTPDMGFTITPEMESTTIFADQFRAPLRHVISQYGATIKMQLLRTSMDAQLFGWVTDDYSFIDPLNPDPSNMNVCITGQHREDYWRGHMIAPFVKSCGVRFQREIVFPKVAVSNLGDIVFKQTEPQLLDLELKVMGDWDVSGYEDVGLMMMMRDHIVPFP